MSDGDRVLSDTVIGGRIWKSLVKVRNVISVLPERFRKSTGTVWMSIWIGHRRVIDILVQM